MSDRYTGKYSGRWSPAVRKAVSAAERARQRRCYCTGDPQRDPCGYCEARVRAHEDRVVDDAFDDLGREERP